MFIRKKVAKKCFIFIIFPPPFPKKNCAEISHLDDKCKKTGATQNIISLYNYFGGGRSEQCTNFSHFFFFFLKKDSRKTLIFFLSKSNKQKECVHFTDYFHFAFFTSDGFLENSSVFFTLKKSNVFSS